MARWLQQIDWSKPHSISELTSQRGARSVITNAKGFYAFVEGFRTPSPDKTLYLGIAVGKRGVRQRLGSYLRTTVTEHKAEAMKHRGKRLISFARIKGVSGRGNSDSNTSRNDKFIHVCWAEAPFSFAAGSSTGNERECCLLYTSPSPRDS